MVYKFTAQAMHRCAVCPCFMLFVWPLTHVSSLHCKKTIQHKKVMCANEAFILLILFKY